MEVLVRAVAHSEPIVSVSGSAMAFSYSLMNHVCGFNDRERCGCAMDEVEVMKAVRPRSAEL